MCVVVAADSNEDTCARPRQLVRGLARRFQRLPGHLQQEPLLRVHPCRLPRADPEEVRVEQLHPLQEPSVPRVRLARRFGIGVVVGIHVPALGGYLRDRVHAFPQQAPERLRARRTPREPAGHANDRDGLRPHALHLLEAGAHPPQSKQRLLLGRQVVGMTGGLAHLKPSL